MVQIASGLMLPMTSLDHFVGPIEAPMRLVQRGAHECPNCGAKLPGVAAVAGAARAERAQDRLGTMQGRLFTRRLAFDQASLIMYLNVASLAPASSERVGFTRTG
jgi:hypothetical protein